MRNLLLLAAASLSAYLGFALLALSQARHWTAVTGESTAPQSRNLRIAGWFLLSLCLLIALFRDGVGFGGLLGVFLFTMTALLTAFTLAWRASWLRGLACFAQRRGRSSDGDEHGSIGGVQ